MKMLITVLIASSTHPPTKAASMPSVAAIVVEITAAAKPTASEIRAPQITCAKTS